MLKKYDMDIWGRAGIISNKHHAFVIASGKRLIKYDLQTGRSVKILEIKEAADKELFEVDGLELNEKETTLYGFTVESVYLVNMGTFQIIKRVDIQIPDHYGEWELRSICPIKHDLLLLQVQIIGGDNLVFLYDTETAFMEFVHKEDTEHKIWLHKKNGIQIIRSKWYKPKCDKNLISCKRGWFYSNKYSFKIEISVMQADEMTVRKPGVLCFSDLDAGFSLVMEDGLRKLRYVFVDKNGKILKEMPSSKNYCPMEAYLVKECKCLLLMYAKKTYLFSYQNLEFKLKKAIRTTFASAPPLYFKETRQLLILDVEKGKWVDMEE